MVKEIITETHEELEIHDNFIPWKYPENPFVRAEWVGKGKKWTETDRTGKNQTGADGVQRRREEIVK